MVLEKVIPIRALVRMDSAPDHHLQARDLEREVRELRRTNEILRKASAFFAQAELDRRPH